VDIDEKTSNIDARKIRERITPRTKVIIPVHLYGQPAEMCEIQNIASEFHLKVLGDCAHAHGARYGNAKVGGIEDIAAFSFYPSKNLGCLGESGMITTNDDELAVWCRRYRDHGSTKKFEHTCIGINARMDGLSAAVLLTKLTYLNEWNEQRRTVAGSYNSLLCGLPIQTPLEVEGVTHVYHIYQIRLHERDKAAEHLMRHGVSTTIHYPFAMHLHPGFSYLQYREGDFPVAERLARETLSLPCFPGMTQDQVAHVATCLKEFCRGDYFQQQAQMLSMKRI
jgi:UDP-2-acetamido-2-deoxy-ribo-hexuluronate aminotransferase